MQLSNETERPDDERWVRIVSGEFSFLVKKKVAMRSDTMRDSLSSGFSEATLRTLDIEERPIITEKVLEYLAHKTTYENAEKKEDIPDFMERIPAELALELLTASDFLSA